MIKKIINEFKKFVNNLKLKNQLLLVSSISIIIASLFIIIAIPKIMMPFYENNIYEVLKHPTNYINSSSENTNSDIAYIIESDFRAMTSNNFYDVLGNINVNYIIEKTTDNYGKLKLNGNTYYYYKVAFRNSIITTFMNDSYITTQQSSLNKVIIPTVFIIFIITLSILFIYSKYLVKKIFRIKNKIDNINNSEFSHDYYFEINDEFEQLNKSIEKMRKEILEKENYKNNMFQSISHELKTPITVISSYTEALKDKVIKEKEALPIISEQCSKLEKYVYSILELNKIAFIKNNNKLKHHKTDIKEVVEKSIKKFKIVRKGIKYILNSDENYEYIGDLNSWELIIDNILSNFIRYSKKIIKITITEDKILLYNDGENIEEKIIDNIFKPYEKGNNGSTGLGLSIVYMTLDMLGYDISVENKEKGVEFCIKKR